MKRPVMQDLYVVAVAAFLALYYVNGGADIWFSAGTRSLLTKTGAGEVTLIPGGRSLRDLGTKGEYHQ